MNCPLAVFLLIGGHWAPDHHHHVSVTIHHNRTSSLSKQVNCSVPWSLDNDHQKTKGNWQIRPFLKIIDKIDNGNHWVTAGITFLL